MVSEAFSHVFTQISQPQGQPQVKSSNKQKYTIIIHIKNNLAR